MNLTTHQLITLLAVRQALFAHVYVRGLFASDHAEHVSNEAKVSELLTDSLNDLFSLGLIDDSVEFESSERNGIPCRIYRVVLTDAGQQYLSEDHHA